MANSGAEVDARGGGKQSASSVSGVSIAFTCQLSWSFSLKAPRKAAVDDENHLLLVRLSDKGYSIWSGLVVSKPVLNLIVVEVPTEIGSKGSQDLAEELWSLDNALSSLSFFFKRPLIS